MDQLEVMEVLCDMCNNNVPMKLKTLVNTLYEADIKPKEATDREKYNVYQFLDYSGSMPLDMYRVGDIPIYRITGYINISGIVKLGNNHREIDIYIVNANSYTIGKGYGGMHIKPVKIEDDIVYIAAIEVESIGDIACIDITKARNSIEESYEYCREIRLANEERIEPKVTDFLKGDW